MTYLVFQSHGKILLHSSFSYPFTCDPCVYLVSPVAGAPVSLSLPDVRHALEQAAAVFKDDEVHLTPKSNSCSL
eukprot:1141227-Amphidinium_carterae.1